MSLLEVEDLRVRFDTPEGVLTAVDGVSYTVDRGEIVCLVGESGSGKTVSAETVTGLTDGQTEGSVRFDGTDLTNLSETHLRKYRGGRIAHVFQNPQGALDPVYSVGRQLTEAIHLHQDRSTAEARERAIDLLDRVGIPEPAARIDDYPHELSGGMRQRVVIAMALACDPDLLIADEPTTALDVTIQASILRLLRDLQAEFDLGVLFITHDLGVVAEIADRVVVMYGGKVMERGPVEGVLRSPAHPYTRALVRCLPGRGDAMEAIGGTVPDPYDPPQGCRFHPRCEYATAACREGDQPPLYDAEAGQAAACLVYDDGRSDADADMPTAPELAADGSGVDDA